MKNNELKAYEKLCKQMERKYNKKNILINEYFYECRRQRLDNNVIDKMLRRNSENKKITFLMQQTIHPGLKKV